MSAEGSNGEDNFYSRNITSTPPQPMGDHTYAHNFPSTGDQVNNAAPCGPQVVGLHQQPTAMPDSIYLEIHEPPAPSAPIADQALQTPAPPVPFVVPQNQTTNGYPHTTQTPSINQGYVIQQHPPDYNELYPKGNPGFNPGPQVYQPQPWGQQFQPNYQSNVVVTTQPQPTPPNVVFVNSVPQRNTSQGLAITSLVLAIIGIFCCFCSICCTIPGIVFAAISLGNSTDPEKAKTHANISMTCTVIGWISGAIVFVVYIIWIFSFTY